MHPLAPFSCLQKNALELTKQINYYFAIKGKMPQRRDPKSKERHLVQSKQDFGFWQRLRGLRYIRQDAQRYCVQSVAVC